MIDLHKQNIMLAYGIHRARCVESGCGLRLTDKEAAVSSRCDSCLRKEAAIENMRRKLAEAETVRGGQGRSGYESEIFAMKWAGLFILGIVGTVLFQWLRAKGLV